MRELLLVCEEHLGAVHVVLGSVVDSLLFRTAVARMSSTHGERRYWPTTDATSFAAELLDMAVDLVSPLEPVAAVRVVASVVDRHFADEMAAEVALVDKLVEMTDRSLVIASDNDLYGASGKKLGPRTGYQADQPAEPARTARCELFHLPAGCTLNVWLDPRHASHLSVALAGLPVAATVHPVVDHVPFSELETVGDGIFGVQPLHAEAAWSETVRLLEVVAENGAKVAVLPELNVPCEVVPSLEGLTVPPLVLSGSRHVDGEAGKVNEAVLHLFGKPVLTHHKTVPFHDLRSSDPTHREAIDVGGSITVLFCAQWTVAALICADVNSPAVMDILKRLRVNMVLVAAMTQAIGYFETRLSSLVQDTQGLGVWSNDPIGHKTVETSAFFFPHKTGQMAALTEPLPAVCINDWLSSPATHPA